MIVTIGLTLFWPLSIGLALFYLVRNRDTVKLPKTLNAKLIYAVATIIFVSSLVAFPYSGSGMYQAAAIMLAPIIVANWNVNARWFNLLAGVQLIWIAVEFTNGEFRPSALSDNGSALGVGALMAFTPLNALLVGVSLSRTALAGLAFYAFLRQSGIVWLLLILAIIAHIFVQLQVQPGRFTSVNIEHSIDNRIAAIDGTNTELATRPVDPIEPKGRSWQWYGYGYGGYVEATGVIQPHNVYLLSYWELGVLAVPFWILLLILAIRSRNLFLAVPALMALVVDEWYTLTEGVFYLLVWHEITKRQRFGLTRETVSTILTRTQAAARVAKRSWKTWQTRQQQQRQ